MQLTTFQERLKTREKIEDLVKDWRLGRGLKSYSRPESDWKLGRLKRVLYCSLISKTGEKRIASFVATEHEHENIDNVQIQAQRRENVLLWRNCVLVFSTDNQLGVENDVCAENQCAERTIDELKNHAANENPHDSQNKQHNQEWN